MATTALEKSNQERVTTLRDLLARSQKQLAAALPRHMKPEHMIRVALTAVQTTPRLMECSPQSILGSVMRAAELGLELSGPLGQAYLIPRYNKKTGQSEANFQLGYRGVIDLCDRSGNLASSPHARVVRPGDTFWYRYGTSPKIHHVPGDKETTDWTHVYAVVFFRRGGTDFEIMTKGQVMAHAERYSQGFKSAYDNPWKSAPEAMAKKTVILALLKRVPVSVEVRQGLAKEDEPVTVDAEVTASPSRMDELAGMLAGPAQYEEQPAGATPDQPRERQPGEDDE